MNAKLFSVLVGVCAFIIAFALGSIITATTGIPLAGGILNGVLVVMIMTIGMLASEHKWTGTMMWFAFSIPAIVTTTLGPPGIYKPIIAIGAGILWDVFHYRLFPSNKWFGLYLGAIFGGAFITFSMIFILKYIIFLSTALVSDPSLAQKSLEKLTNYIWYLVPVNVVVTVIGVKLGEHVYINRLKSVINVEK